MIARRAFLILSLLVAAFMHMVLVKLLFEGLKWWYPLLFSVIVILQVFLVGFVFTKEFNRIYWIILVLEIVALNVISLFDRMMFFYMMYLVYPVIFSQFVVLWVYTISPKIANWKNRERPKN